MNKKLTQIKKNYETSTEISLDHAYAKPSHNKTRIYAACERERIESKGYGQKIISHNCQFFTYGYLMVCPVNGNILLKVITPCNNYTIDY